MVVAAALAIGGTFLIRGELGSWVQHVPAGPAVAALFRTVAMPGGPVPILLPPAESRPALAKMIAAAPRDAMLYRLRAQEDEVALDFAAAEADWKANAGAAADRYAGYIALADFYHRRIQPRDELAALETAATEKDDPLRVATAQPGWRAFERMAALSNQEDLPPAVAEPVFRAWVARYPKERGAWHKLIDYLSEHRQIPAAKTAIDSYSRAFHDELEPVRMRADLALRDGSPEAALAVYDRAFRPLWPDDMAGAYFKLLGDQGKLRDFAGGARAALAANPADLDATARLFHYFKSQNNAAAARRVLLEYRLAKESGAPAWSAAELLTMAQLFERLPDANEAARMYYALYSAPGGTQAERALYGLASLLLSASGEPIQFGGGDLSFYKDIATIDPSPGVLNGILSLVLNSTWPRMEYQNQNQKSVAYFHRAAASQLVSLLEQRFPHSAYREPLRAVLINAYATYGDDASVIRAGREYLTAFPNGAGRVSAAMQISDSFARQSRTAEEFALYDQLLSELAAKSSGVPLGPAGNARSAEYAQVLDKYLSRLAALDRPLDGLRVYRNEIVRNPDDPGLYERLAAFLEQNDMAREVEQVYAKAIARFATRSWYDKLARWYLRTRQMSALEKISRDAIVAFSGTDLEAYFREVVSQTHPNAALYLRLNLYAHQRFPEDLVFVQNLLAAYRRRETYDAASADRLLRQYWFYDAQLRSQFFAMLSSAGRLYRELAAIRAANPGIAGGGLDHAVAENPAAVQFAATAEIWLSHFEAAAPVARALANAYPGRREFTGEASSLYRSLAAYDPRDTGIAAILAADSQRADPRDTEILANIGDIFADRGLFARAGAFWERIPSAEPGKPEAYLTTATIYWDYYHYNDALRWIAAARRKFHKPALYAYQAGAIYENKRDDLAAAHQYIAGAFDGEIEAQNRLLRLSNRPRTRDLVDKATAAAVNADPSPAAVRLRIAVLEQLQRRPDLQRFLESRVTAERLPAGLTELQETARRLGFEGIEEQACERLAAITSDPVDKMRLTLAYVRLLEAKKDTAGAARVAGALYRDHPLILGVVRGVVDFHLRNKQPDAAIGILSEAAKSARADLAAQFTLESARIATDSGEFERARTLLAGVLAADPLRAEYLATMADTYIKAKDDRGFRDYELATIQRLKQSALAPAERIERITAIRRSLIPVLDRLKDDAGAVDQYIEVVNNYPEDEGLAKQAAAFAVAHGQAARLIAFYRKTVAGAPRDYRWPIVLARIETVAEDFPAAIAAYERAITARPDRADVFEAKGRLEERLARFADAIATYSRLYELTYRDPQWMVKVAELDARSGHTQDAVSALQTAIIGRRSETADADFAIVEQLEGWRILPEAVAFAERGARAAADELFKRADRARIYARIMARARRMDAVLPLLADNPAADRQVGQAAGAVIQETYTPEEKARLAQFMISESARRGTAARDAILLPLAASAGLTELECRWRLEAMRAQSQRIDPRFVALEFEGARFAELGRNMEEYGLNNDGQPVLRSALVQAAEAFIAAGDIESQMHVMQLALSRNVLSGVLLDRYLWLLAERNPEELLAIIGDAQQQQEIRDRAAQFAIASDQPALAYRALQVRGARLAPVWKKAYTALTGDYYSDQSSTVDAAFQAALDTRTIGERLSSPWKTDTIIAGSVWFYYGARYGDYLAAAKNESADAWLPAYVESAPRGPARYIALGDAYAHAGQGAKAIAEYEHALELDGNRGDAGDHIARVLWPKGRRPEAIARWKAAIAAFQRVQDGGVRVPEPYWNWVAETLGDIGECRAFSGLRSDIARLLGDYYQRNNQYRLSELVEPAIQASVESGEGVGWAVDLANSIDEPEAILFTVMNTPGLTDAQRIELKRNQIAIDSKRAQASFGDTRQFGFSQVDATRLELVSMLLNVGDVQGALSEWKQIPPLTVARTRWDSNQFRDEVEIRLAAKTNGLAALLERYDTQLEFAPPLESLRNAAVVLQTTGGAESAHEIFEFMYGREIRNGNLEPANFIGLAEVKLQRNDVAAAVAILNRMALVTDDAFESLLPAADVLSKFGKTAEAAQFIRRRITAAPWDAAAKVQLARTLSAGSTERRQLLAAVVTDTQAPYKLRAEAARMSAPQTFAEAAGTELALLASGVVTANAAAKPYQIESRMEAARQASDSDAKLRLWLEALAIAPADERVRLGALRTAISLRRDSLTMALARTGEQRAAEFEAETPFAPRRVGRWHQATNVAAVLPQMQLGDQERATLAESLAGAAERLDDLDQAAAYLRAAITLRPTNQRDVLESRLKSIVAEQDRRARNAARQPVVRNVIEQDQIVRPRIVRSAP